MIFKSRVIESNRIEFYKNLAKLAKILPGCPVDISAFCSNFVMLKMPLSKKLPLKDVSYMKMNAHLPKRGVYHTIFVQCPELNVGK